MSRLDAAEALAEAAEGAILYLSSPNDVENLQTAIDKFRESKDSFVNQPEDLRRIVDKLKAEKAKLLEMVEKFGACAECGEKYDDGGLCHCERTEEALLYRL